jgi:hypothetical protein
MNLRKSRRQRESGQLLKSSGGLSAQNVNEKPQKKMSRHPFPNRSQSWTCIIAWSIWKHFVLKQEDSTNSVTFGHLFTTSLRHGELIGQSHDELAAASLACREAVEQQVEVMQGRTISLK